MNRIKGVVNSVLVFIISGSICIAQPAQSSKPQLPPASENKDSLRVNPEADKAWKLLEEALNFPSTPQSWTEKPPSREEFEKFRDELISKVLAAIKLANEFASKYPKDPRALEASKIEYQLLLEIYKFGTGGLDEKLQAVEKRLLSHPEVTTQEKIVIRYQQLHRELVSKVQQSQQLDINAYNNGIIDIARTLIKEFPTESLPYEFLLSESYKLSLKERRELIQLVLDSKQAPKSAREMAAAALRGLETLGKPLELSFTAFDGKRIDIKDYKGKVVLIDFWASWCGPCVQELPRVKQVYEKYKDKGFEIIGISLDQDKEAMEKFLKQYNITWPQYFDGKGWQNKWAQYYGIHAIPTMWIVDKKGVVRYINVREDLETKIQELLTE